MMPSIPLYLVYLVFALVCLAPQIYSATEILSDIPLCKFECESRVVLDEENLDVACNETCKIKRCHDGCDAWKKGVKSSCQKACEEEKSILSKSSNLYCVMGCSIAISTYVTKLKDEFGMPEPPYLVAGSCTNDSVTLNWNPAPVTDIFCLVQWRYNSSQLSNEFEYYEPSALLTTNALTLRNLHPYTNYKFRIAWMVTNTTPLFSEESVTISTLDYGIPSTSPSSMSLTAVGPTRISISWEAPLFPNGPILSYVLYVREYPSGFVAIKDVPVTSSSGLHYMFNDLKPGTTYIISVTTRNNKGEGPEVTKNLTTYVRDVNFSSHNSLPYLIFGAEDSVVQQGIRILDVSRILYSSRNNSISINGVALHVKKELIFFSDSEGSIYRLKGEKIVETIFKASANIPTVLSVDWLNERLYMVQGNEICRCSFKGDRYEVVLTGLLSEPAAINVDPYNGYLFWVISDPTNGGLYRIDLAEIESGPRTQKDSQEFLKDLRISAFAVDYKSFRLFLPYAKNNTILSSALDGSDAKDIRNNSQTSQFTDVVSIAVHENLFYWTNGEDMFAEEYHHSENMFYHNAYPLTNGLLSSINIHHQHCQPDPIPLTPVESVQAIFSDRKVQIRWFKPHIIGGIGKGSWQKWLYEVYLNGINVSLHKSEKAITKHMYVMEHLLPNTLYSIKVRAYTSAGEGPWSSVFHGHTLKSNNYPDYPFILSSTREGLLKSDILGENIQNMIPKLYFNNVHIEGISWYTNRVFFNTNSSWVYVYNIGKNHSLSILKNVTYAASIAVDWFAPKIYWSTPMQQMISRADLDGSRSEPLPIVTMAKQLAIDSRYARIYWATSHSIECSRLNGDDHFSYMKNELFSGKHVMGLTLDLDMNAVYWVIRSHEGARLYKATLADETWNPNTKLLPDLLGELPEDDLRGPMSYFNDRLFFIHEHKGTLLSDRNGRNIASLQRPGLNSLKALTIIDPSLQPYPDGYTKDTIRVIPSSVVDTSIRIQGTFDKFNIVWDAVESTNVGTVFYEVIVNDGNEMFTTVSKEPIFSYPTMKHLQPYSTLNVAVKAYTYWASSRQTLVYIHSPMSTPSSPLDPRVFITYKMSPLRGNRDIQAIFRWLAPAYPNGVVIGYEIVWYAGNETNKSSREKVDGSKLEFVVNNLKKNTNYIFEIRAYTQVGSGPYSQRVHARTSEEYPVPQLVFARADAVKIADIDTHEEKLLSRKVSRPTSVAYLAHENRLFWLEENGALMSSLLDGTNVTLVRHLTEKITAISIDWISRELYWTEVKNENSSSIYSVEIDNSSLPNLVLNHSGIIVSLEAEPFTSSLLWILNKGTHFELMISSNKGELVRSVFWKNNSNTKSRRNSACNCLHNNEVGRAIAIDNANSTFPQVIWVDGQSGHIWSSDISGCRCHLLFNSSSIEPNGLPPSSLTIDGSRIYWTNETMGKLFSINRERNLENGISAVEPLEIHSPNISSEDIGSIRAIRAIASNLQPFPDRLCLIPLLEQQKAELHKATSSTLTLYLPQLKRRPHCGKISMAAIKYRVKYAHEGEECFTHKLSHFHNCKYVQTDKNMIIIQGLQPFTNYSISVAASNYYTEEYIYGPAVVYRTREGVPSAPRNITALVVTPFSINVYWKSPVLPNGDNISYEVLWKTEDNLSNLIILKDYHFMELENLFTLAIATKKPSTNHYVHVRAYSQHRNLYNDSDEVVVRTYDKPGDLTASSITFSSLCILWQSHNDSRVTHHKLSYSKVGSTVWNSTIVEVTKPSTMYKFPIFNLDSKTKYKFHLILTYFPMNVILQYPEDTFEVETKGIIPSKPGEPRLHSLITGKYEVTWDEATGNDGDELLYELQIRGSGNWTIVYNGSYTEWIITKNLSSNTSYEFRVKALNKYGQSDFSLSGKSFTLSEEIGAYVDPKEDQVGVFMVSAVAIIIVLTLILSVFYVVYRRQVEKIPPDTVDENEVSPDFGLHILQELPHHGNFIHQTNALYNLGDLPTDEELLALPQIERNQIRLTKFLGSGAFGEVFEGIARDLIEGLPPMNVAIKTLRKGATEHEKEEFLKEAKLMSNFKHDHILQLLGVCFDNNPNFIILELMDGGDLLSYLRTNRPPLFERSLLTLQDLFGICVDVAKGCKYLEDMHFVHRDLAARNCLVSSYDREHRIVKLGDFGLARDIYKNDYYRKNGEGLLPVRWMAPESLVYGIFTSQSDVWAFGILLWEVMTLGEKPYPARSNVEVLRYVRGGGRLDKPENCPDDLWYEVMERCWSYDPDGRPTFSYCLSALQILQTKIVFSPALVSSLQNESYYNHSLSGGYIIANTEMRSNVNNDSEDDDDTYSTRSDPVRSTVMGLLQSYKVKRSASLNHQVENMLNRNTLPVTSAVRRNECMSSGNNNKYLELLRDNEDGNGYEIPLRAEDIFLNRISGCSKDVSVSGQNFCASNDDKCLEKPFLVPSYAHVFSDTCTDDDDDDDVFTCGQLCTERRACEQSSQNCNIAYTCFSHPLAMDKTNEEASTSTSRLYFDESPISSSSVCDKDSDVERNSCEKGSETDHSSASTASTAPCDSPCSSSSPKNNRISSLSEIGKINLNYVINSSWC